MAARVGALTENIALLALCATTFEPVTEDFLPLEIPAIGGHTLTLQHEQQITEAFAILLAHTDDPSAVGAICVEEQRNLVGLLVRTAVNSGSQRERMTNFKRIARALEECAMERNEEAFFEEIIAACQPRLLGRLRSCHGRSFRKAAKPAIISRLYEAMHILNQLRIRPYGFASVQDQIASLENEYMRLEALPRTDAHSGPGRQCLKVILCVIEKILASTDIRALLNRIPKETPAWSGPAADSLARRLMCLAQYQYAARYLLRRARKDSKFRRLSIAEIPSGLFPASPHGSEPHSVGYRLA
ncbi:hypothetical protein PMIN03_012406 [Paraphaeosphaeria minitans]